MTTNGAVRRRAGTPRDRCRGIAERRRPELPSDRRPPELEKPAPALPRISPLSDEERSVSLLTIAKRCSAAVGLTSDIVDQRLKTPRIARSHAGGVESSHAHSKKNQPLEFMLREFQNMQDRDLSEVFSRLAKRNRRRRSKAVAARGGRQEGSRRSHPLHAVPGDGSHQLLDRGT